MDVKFNSTALDSKLLFWEGWDAGKKLSNVMFLEDGTHLLDLAYRTNLID